MKLEVANQEQIEEIVDIVNSAYRGDIGWTKETDIVDGARTSISEIQSLISKPDAHLLIAKDKGGIFSCVCMEEDGCDAYIGMFAVKPDIQGNGIGKAVLQLAEEYALVQLRARKLILIVVSQRPELISYYERRGYVKTGQIEEYPIHLNVGVPKVTGLTIQYLEKHA